MFDPESAAYTVRELPTGGEKSLRLQQLRGGIDSKVKKGGARIKRRKEPIKLLIKRGSG
jgi:hypothetical protein